MYIIETAHYYEGTSQWNLMAAILFVALLFILEAPSSSDAGKTNSLNTSLVILIHSLSLCGS